MKILVLGAGVIGTTTAYRLAELGHDVAVVDRNAGPALGTSRGNAGLLTPSQAAPWNEPGIAWQVPKLLRDESGAIAIRPRLEPALWTWLLRFLIHSSQHRHTHHAAAILALARHSRREIDRIAAAAGIAFDRTDRGVLTLIRGRSGPVDAERALGKLRGLGIAAAILDRDRSLAMEPALAPIADQIAGGLHTPEDASGDAHAFTAALAVAAGRAGVTFRYDTPIEAVRVAGRAVGAIVAGGENLTADLYVVACGTGTGGLLGSIGLRLPIYPVQGVSLTLSVPDWPQRPAMPVRDPTLRVAITPFVDRLRIAGMAILNGGDLTIKPQHVATLRRSVGEIFPRLPPDAPAVAWSGVRPMTPDGPPIIGRTRYDNLCVNAGHGPLGWTLSCRSADVLASLIENRVPAIAAAPFAADRYAV